MDRQPPEGDEQPSYSPRQFNQSTMPPKRPHIEYHADEHPEIPIIRRASLFLDPQEPPLPLEPVVNEESLRNEQAEGAYAQHDTNARRGIRHQRTPYQSPLPPPIYQSVPLSSASPTRQTNAKGPFWSQLQHQGHNRAVIICSCLVLFVLLIALIILNVGRSQMSGFLSTIGSQAGQQSNILAANVQPGVDRHQLLIVPQDTDHPAPPVYAASAYLLDADTGSTLYAYNPFIHLPMLSTTKLMTAVLAVEQGIPEQKITITNAISADVSHLSADSTRFGFKKGETYTLHDMLYALLLVSGNDAAIAIADTLAGNLTHFVAEMNQRAQELGLSDTHFMNPHGLLDPGQYSCAHDLALLGQYSLSLPFIHQVSSTQIYTIPQGGNHPQRFLVNGNQFLFWYPGVDGGKPGWDGASNFVQVVSSTRYHHHLIGVTMHTIDWWTDMRDLLNWGFDSFSWISPYDVDFQHPIPYDNLWNYFVKDKKTNTIPTVDHGRYYIYTGFSISGLIMAYFDQKGGLKQFGYPLSLQTALSASVVSESFEQGSIQCNLTTKECVTI